MALTAAAEVDAAQAVAAALPQCGPGSLRRLVGVADIREFKTGQSVVAQGDETLLILVLNGHIASRRTTFDGREVIPRIVSPGGLASLLPLVGRPSVADAVALTPCHIALWSGSEVQELAAGDAGLALDLLDHVLRSLEEVVEGLDGFLYQDARGRVARVLEGHAGMFFGKPPVLTRAHLPALVGTSREMTGRVLRRLESDGVVARTGRDGLQLLDATGLATAAGRQSPARGGDHRNMFLAKRRGAMQQ
jgi:CRP-like cAMP-binding protein